MAVFGYPSPFNLTRDCCVGRKQRGANGATRACGAVTDYTFLMPALDLAARIAAAQLGAKVCLVERQRLVWILLQERAVILRVLAICGEAAEVLARPPKDPTATPWDVILLDPMFPPRGKKALPNRGLQHLRELTEDVGAGDDALALLRLALGRTAGRVVVKRRLKDAQLLPADFQIKGKSIRFDIYRGQLPAG